MFKCKNKLHKNKFQSTRISRQEALYLLKNADITELMGYADAIRAEKHGKKVYFVHSLNVNPTNICENQCKLCAFWRNIGEKEAYFVSFDEAKKKMTAAKTWQLTDVHIVGGLSKKVGINYYQKLFHSTKEILPSTIIQALTAVEIQWLCDIESLSVKDVLSRLQGAGLDAMPGGGAEIFSEHVRNVICSKKISADNWLYIHETAHNLGIPSNATMLFGHIETAEDIVEHLDRLRRLQDQTGGFLAFCLLPFHAHGTKLEVESGPTGHIIAKIAALSRIFLDNFPHIRVLANFLDRKLLQTLLYCGADDIGGTSIDEQIARSAGASDKAGFSSPKEISEFIEELGFEPILTNSIYKNKNANKKKPLVIKKPLQDVSTILEQAERGERVNAEQAILLYDNAPLYELGRIAHKRRCEIVGGDKGTFIIDRNISFTNVCIAGCRFCAFHKRPGQKGGFVMTIEEIVSKAEQAVKLGATQIMLQGGLNPALDLEWYEKMLSSIKNKVDVRLHSLSPAEVLWLSEKTKLTIRQTLERLRAAGLDSLPGGGAEILVDEIRKKVSPGKLTTEQWLEVMETAQASGMGTTATMVYGFGETTAQRVEHLLRIRELQDRTGGFRAFIPWSFQSNNTQLCQKQQSGVAYLRTVAMARIVLDNIEHVQAGWVTEGHDMAQLALCFGADDFGGVLMEESVVKATGLDFGITAEKIVSLIIDAGMIAAERNTEYEILDVKRQMTKGRRQMTEDRGQKAEGRRQRAEGRGQMTDGRGQRADDKRQKTEGRRQMTEGRRQRAEDRRQKTDDRGQKAEGRGQMTEGRGQRYPEDKCRD